MATFLKRRESGSGKARQVEAVTVESADSAFAKKYPALAEFISLEEWSEGVPRTRGTITVFWEDGAFKASLNDRDSESVAFVSKNSFAGLLDALEKGLVGSTHDWRGWRGKGKQGSKRS